MTTSMFAAMPTPKDYATSWGDRMIDSLDGIVSDPLASLRESREMLSVPKYALDLGILSASQYPQAPIPSRPAESGKKRTSSQQYYGGVLLDDEELSSETSTPAPAEERRRPKKKTKSAAANKSDDDDDHNNRKQRGRPRLDTQDETAADRRRTQIRLAQRAYRHRKESTISTLKHRVEDLEAAIERMNNLFQQFQDNLVDSGALHAQPVLERQLRATNIEFVALANLAAQDADKEDEANDMAAITESRSKTLPAESHVEETTSAEQYPANNNAMWGYSMPFEEPPADNTPVEGMPRQDAQLEMSLFPSTSKSWSFEGDFQQYSAMMSEPYFDIQPFLAEIERPLKTSGPYTYSFQETTFARRLHRMTIERAFGSLNNPTINPDFIKRSFRFTFCFTNKKRMLARFQELLKRKAGESLENWEVPFFQVGGAGTHFPRRDESGRPIYPPNMISPAQVLLPQPWIEPETPRDEKTTQQLLEAIGFGGEWFDSHDVEEYLKTKGVYLDGHSSFVDVDPSMISPPSLSTSASASSSNSGGSPTKTPEPTLAGMPDVQTFLAEEFREIFDSNDFLAPIQKSTELAAVGSEGLDFEMPVSPGYTPTLQDLVRRKSRPVTLDVTRFLERLLDGSACLGRAPGFRRQNIDNALFLSLQEAF